MFIPTQTSLWQFYDLIISGNSSSLSEVSAIEFKGDCEHPVVIWR